MVVKTLTDVTGAFVMMIRVTRILRPRVIARRGLIIYITHRVGVRMPAMIMVMIVGSIREVLVSVRFPKCGLSAAKVYETCNIAKKQCKDANYRTDSLQQRQM